MPPATHSELTAGAVLWRVGGSVLNLDGRVDAERLLEALRRAGVTHVDVVVVRTASPAVVATVEAVRRRTTIGEVLTPTTVTSSTTRVVGNLTVDVRPEAGRLSVTIDIDRDVARGARGPPV